MKNNSKITSLISILKGSQYPFQESVQSAQSTPRTPGEKGVALIISLTAIVFIMNFVVDLMVTSHVATRMTLNLQDTARAESLASSAEKMAVFLLTIDYGIDLKTYELSQVKPVDSLADFWGMLNNTPIGSGENDMLKTLIKMFGLSELMDSSVVDKLRDFFGYFQMSIADESARINLSYLQTAKMGEQVASSFTRLLDCQRSMVEDKNLTAEEMVYRVYDFMDLDKRVQAKSGLTGESHPYDSKAPAYKPINRPLTSVGQLRLIHGWDSQMHAVFSPYLTVFPIPNMYQSLPLAEFGKSPFLNINSISREMFQCLFPDLSSECYDSFVVKHTKAIENKETLAIDDSGISKALDSLVCYQKDPENTVDLTQWFRTTSSTYRIRSLGVSGDVSKIKEIVVERLTPEFMKENQRPSSWDMLYSRNGSE